VGAGGFFGKGEEFEIKIGEKKGGAQIVLSDEERRALGKPSWRRGRPGRAKEIWGKGKRTE
jgi:hypothetical protein